MNIFIYLYIERLQCLATPVALPLSPIAHASSKRAKDPQKTGWQRRLPRQITKGNFILLHQRVQLIPTWETRQMC